jgi:hypothetical protein
MAFNTLPPEVLFRILPFISVTDLLSLLVPQRRCSSSEELRLMQRQRTHDHAFLALGALSDKINFRER